MEANSQSSYPDPVQDLPLSDQQQAYSVNIDLLDKQRNDENNGDGDDRNGESTVEALNVGLSNDLPLLLINDQPLTPDDQSRYNKVESINVFQIMWHYFLCCELFSRKIGMETWLMT